MRHESPCALVAAVGQYRGVAAGPVDAGLGKGPAVVWRSLWSCLSAFHPGSGSAEHDWLATVRLPPYAPDLNPVEAVWSLVRRAMANTSFTTPDDLDPRPQAPQRDTQNPTPTPSHRRLPHRHETGHQPTDPTLKTSVNNGYPGLRRDHPAQAFTPPRKPRPGALPGRVEQWERDRHGQSSDRITVEHALADHNAGSNWCAGPTAVTACPPTRARFGREV
ncbi:transposase [Streptomyces atroolivaceus]